MKKQWKAVISMVLMLTLFMTISIGVMAEDGTNIPGYNTTNNKTKDMDHFTFVKTFEMLGDTANGVFPKEDFIVSFEPCKVSGLPTGKTMEPSDMPTINPTTITSAMIESQPYDSTKHCKKMAVDVNLPTYTYIGDYWYRTKETVKDEAGEPIDVAGVTHDPNTYYLHVQVVYDTEKGGSIARLVTLHKPDPTDQTTYINAKTDGVINIYENGGIVIKKSVNGSTADADKAFKVYVTMSSPNPVSSDITYKFFDNSNVEQGSPVVINHSEWTKAGSTYTLSKEVEITANKRVEFYNIPFGITYTVKEAEYSSGYKIPTYNIDSELKETDDIILGSHSSVWTDKGIQGTISDERDTITIINTTDATIDVGVIIDNMPYIVIMLFVVGSIVVFFATRHKKETID